MLGGDCSACCSRNVHVGFRNFTGPANLDSWNLQGGDGQGGVPISRILATNTNWETLAYVKMRLAEFGRQDPTGTVDIKGTSGLVSLRLTLGHSDFPNQNYIVIYEKPRNEYEQSYYDDARIVFSADEAVSVTRTRQFDPPVAMNLEQAGETGIVFAGHTFSVTQRRYTLEVSSPAATYTVNSAVAWGGIQTMYPGNLDGVVGSFAFEEGLPWLPSHSLQCAETTSPGPGGSRKVTMSIGENNFLTFGLQSIGVRTGGYSFGTVELFHSPLKNFYQVVGAPPEGVGSDEPPAGRAVSPNAWAAFAVDGVLESGVIHAWPKTHNADNGQYDVREWGPMSFTITQAEDLEGPYCGEFP